MKNKLSTTMAKSGVDQFFRMAKKLNILLSLCFWFMVGESLLADITIVERESMGRLRVFTGSGGAANIDDVQDSTNILTGVFVFNETFSSIVTEADPFSNGSATASGSIVIMDEVIQSNSTELSLTSLRSSNATVEYGSGSGNATSGPRHQFRVRFMVVDEPVRYKISGFFEPGPIMNGVTSLSLFRPFTTNTLFEYDSMQVLDETGVLQPGLTYEIRVRVNDLLAASSTNPGPTFELSSYDFEFDVANILYGDVNLDGQINLLDVGPFVDSISNGQYQIEADLDENGVVNLLDVGPFIDLLAGD